VGGCVCVCVCVCVCMDGWMDSKGALVSDNRLLLAESQS
jgi:hypothetical protein